MKMFVFILMSASAGLLVGYWLYPQLNPIEVAVGESQRVWSDEPVSIADHVQPVKEQSTSVAENSLLSDKKAATEVLADTPLNPLQDEIPKAKPAQDNNEPKVVDKTLKAMGKVDDFSNHEEVLRALKWNEAGEAYEDGTEHEQWAQDMHRNITDFIQNTEYAYDIYIERVNCNSQGCEVVGKDNATRSWQRLVWSMKSQSWWTLEGTKGSSENATRGGEGYFYYVFSRY